MTATRTSTLPSDLLAPGEPVEVFNSFDGMWSSGFEIAEVLGGPPNWTYRIKRVSDGAVLPRNFDHGALSSTSADSNGWMATA